MYSVCYDDAFRLLSPLGKRKKHRLTAAKLDKNIYCI